MGDLVDDLVSDQKLMANEAQRDNQVWSSSDALIMGVRLPPDLLETWWERVLAVVAIALVGWTLIDIMRHGL